VTELALGCVVIVGATTAAVTVKVAALLVAEPALLVTTTVKLPASLVEVELIEYVDEVAPLIDVPSFFHW
jgi:hypothetical protein